MKIRQTNADISDLKDSINEAVDRFKNNNPINIYGETIRRLSEPLKGIIKDIVDHNQFERLVKCYFERIGADDVFIPSKRDGEGYGDGDIVARFDALKLLVYVQAKHHSGITGDWGIKQISEYTDQKNRDSVDSDYNAISWVISSADEFSAEAQALAIEKNVKLINGEEFRKMLIDVGIRKWKSISATGMRERLREQSIALQNVLTYLTTAACVGGCGHQAKTITASVKSIAKAFSEKAAPTPIVTNSESVPRCGSVLGSERLVENAI